MSPSNSNSDERTTAIERATRAIGAATPWRRYTDWRLGKLEHALVGEIRKVRDELHVLQRAAGLPDTRSNRWRGGDNAAEEYATLVRHRTQHFEQVREPLVLISQVQRSGGTLLSQLFDNHPQLHAHPQELRTGSPKKEVWPSLSLDDGPDEWFSTLYEGPAERAFREGYSKVAGEEGGETFPFVFPPLVQKAVFDACVARRRPDSARAIFDCYMTSYFNAWLDNHNLYTGPKRWITAFAARLIVREQSVEGFFDTYSDGRLISILRDPRSWYVSARRFRELSSSPSRRRDYATIESAIEIWRSSAEAMLLARERHGEAVLLLSFEDLLGDTEATMRRVAAFLEIDFTPTLLQPTFNGLAIKADSSFAVRDHGVSTEPLERFREELSADELAHVEEHAMPLYERVAQVTAAASAGR